ncbi:hypothetical protein Tco_0496474 [Tanacetum coccineum]
MTAKKLEDIHNFKQEGGESLYHAWEWYNDLLYKCPTHEINSHKKDETSPSSHSNSDHGYHSQKWHDGTTSQNIESSSSKDGLAALDLTSTRIVPLNEEVKQVEEVGYGEFGRIAPFNGNNEGKFRIGPPGYYTKTDNHLPYGERRKSLE